MTNPESSKLVSELHFKLTSSRYEQLVLVTQVKPGTSVQGIMEAALGVRLWLENIRDTGKSTHVISPLGADSLLILSHRAIETDAEAIAGTDMVDMSIPVTPELLADLTEQYEREGFMSFDAYMSSCLDLYHQLQAA